VRVAAIRTGAAKRPPPGSRTATRSSRAVAPATTAAPLGSAATRGQPCSLPSATPSAPRIPSAVAASNSTPPSAQRRTSPGAPVGLTHAVPSGSRVKGSVPYGAASAEAGKTSIASKMS
jgi:hypothetical protein